VISRRSRAYRARSLIGPYNPALTDLVTLERWGEPVGLSRRRSIPRHLRGTMLALMVLLFRAEAPASAATTWNTAMYLWLSPMGPTTSTDNAVPSSRPSQPLGGTTTGCSFNGGDQALHNQLEQQQSGGLRRRRPHRILQTIATSSGRNESVVLRADTTFYVSHSLGGSIDHLRRGRQPRRQSRSRRPPPTGWTRQGPEDDVLQRRGLARRASLRRVRTQRPPRLATGLPGPTHSLFAYYRPGWDGGLLVATSNAIERLDGIRKHTSRPTTPRGIEVVCGQPRPNGTSFWSGSATTDNFYRFNIATGRRSWVPSTSEAAPRNHLVGLCVKGELTAAPTPSPTPTPRRRARRCWVFLPILCPSPTPTPAPTPAAHSVPKAKPIRHGTTRDGDNTTGGCRLP